MLIPLLVILFLLILVCVALYQSTSTWNWLHISLVFLVFVSSVLAAYAGSVVLTTRLAWMERARDNRARLEELDQEYRTALYGPDTALAYPADSLLGRNHQLWREALGSGRVWREGRVGVQNDQVTLTFATEDGTGAVNLVQDLTVHAFVEEPISPEIPDSFPATFVGSFVIGQSEGDEVVLRPIYLTLEGREEIQNPQSTWALFENMPRDRRDVFKVHAGITPENFDLTEYRRLLEEVYLPAEKVGMDADSVEYEALIDSYAFDGLQMSEILTWISQQPDRRVLEFDPPAEHRYVQVQFNRPSPPFQVDAVGTPEEGAFDALGRAVDPLLKAGGEITFSAEEVVLLPKLAAVIGYERSDGSIEPPLIDTVDAERIGDDLADFYFRPLKDYPHLLAQTTRQLTQFEEESVQVRNMIEMTDTALNHALTQVDLRTNVLNELEQDLDNFQRDLQQITEARQRVEQRVAEQLETIQTLYKQIQQMYEQLNDSLSSNDPKPSTRYATYSRAR